MTDSRPHIAGLLPDQILEHFRAHPQWTGGTEIRDDECRRLLAQAVSSNGVRAQKSRPLAGRTLALARDVFDYSHLEIVERDEDDTDGFVKYLFRHGDGALSEAVRIPLEKPGTFTVCLSSQVGCAMQCAFCATGRLGLTRNLQAWEIVQSLVAVRDEAPGRVTGAVFMGQGEPLSNYDEVMQAAQVLSHPAGCAIAADAITISTVGLVPQIRRFATERRPYRLIVSLTSAVAERRRELLPVASKFSPEQVASALGAYAEACKTRVTIAWVLMAGVNTGQDELTALREIFGDLPLRINLIDVNDSRPDGYRPPDATELASFRDRLRALGVPVVRRYSGGRNKDAACGMLAARRQGSR